MELDRQEERPAYVQFETKPEENVVETREQGRWIGTDVDYALITPPGTRDCVVMKVDTWLDNARKNVANQRIPDTWLAHWERMYAAYKDGKEAPLNGSPIIEWNIISPATQKLLVSLKIMTVEDLAQINDEGMRRIGMGANELKRKAKKWLESSDVGATAIKLAELEKANEELRLTVNTLMERLSLSKNEEYTEESNDITADDILEPMTGISQVMTPAKEYERVVGKKPNKNWKESTVVARLKEYKKLNK